MVTRNPSYASVIFIGEGMPPCNCKMAMTMMSIIHAIAFSLHPSHHSMMHKFKLNHYDHGILHHHQHRHRDEQPRSRMPLSLPGIEEIAAPFAGMVLLAPAAGYGRRRARGDAARSARDGDGDGDCAVPLPITISATYAWPTSSS